MKQSPAPGKLPFLHSVIALGKTDPLSFWRNAHTQHGDIINLKVGPMNIWFFASPEAIYDILVSKHRLMRKGVAYKGLRKLLGEGLITTDKEHWSSQRESLNPLFSPSAIKAYSSSVYDAVEAGMVELKQLASSGQPVDIGHAMTRLTMRVISRAAFGVDLADGHDEIVDAFEFAFGFIADITAQPMHAPLFVPTANNRKFKQALKTIEKFTDGLIDDAVSKSSGDDLNNNIFAALKGNDRKLLRDEFIGLYFAGYETTARTMTFLMHMLSKNPETLETLRSEASKLKRPNNLEDVTQSLPYATEVVNEALRLYPPIAMLARQNNTACEIEGVKIGANSILIVCPFVAQRNKKFWPSGDAFKPSLKKPFAKRITHRGAFSPFGAGPRMCIGKHFAMVELVIAITKVSQSFEWELLNDSEIELDFHGSLRPKSPIFAHLSKR